MRHALRIALVVVLSASFIYAPLFALRSVGLTYARENNPVQQAGKHTPPKLAAHEPNTLLIKFNPAAKTQSQYLISTFAKGQQALRGQSAVTKLTLKDGLDLDATMNTLRQLDGAVELVEPNYLVKRATAGTSSSPRAVKKATHDRQEPGGSNSTIIAVIDSGIDLHHRDLKHALWFKGAEQSGLDDLRGWNFIAGNSDVRDDIGHGTQVAGIIAKAAGIRRGSTIGILPLKALDQSGTGTIAEVVEAMDYAIARHVAVINCSFGTAGYSQAMLDAIKRAETAGIVVVAAAGNDAKDLSQSPFYPAAFRSYQAQNVISVAATDERRVGEVTLAGFSNFNADIAAPGTSIRTTHPNNSHVNLTGTSAAAGFVTGAVARLKSVRGWVSAQTVRESILKSAQDSSGLPGILSNKVASHGSVNAEAALSFFTRDKSSSQAKAGRMGKGQPVEVSPAVQALLGAGANLDLLRNNHPQAPAPHQPIGTLPGPTQGSLRQRSPHPMSSLPGATYDDPKPTITANYNAYLTEMSKAGNATGLAGSQPMQTVDPTAGSASVSGFSYNLDSRNYNFTAPVMSLAGRAGLDLSLALSYNSNVWVRDTTHNVVAFNADRGFPAPGWRLGFGAIQIQTNTTGVYYNGVTGQYSIIYISPDGTRHDMAQTSSTTYKTYDSSYIVFDAATQVMSFPNGTQATYGAYSYDASNYDFQALPTEFKDRNGNFISINYKTLNCGSNGSKTVIDYVVDTGGRRVDFNYQNNRLTSISQTRGSSTFTYVYIDYDPVTIQTNFTSATTDPSAINGTAVYFPTRLTYPTGINFRFTYTSYGQISAIEKWVPTITGQGTEHKIASTSFDLPGYGLYNYQYASPSFSNRYEWAENWNGGSVATYQYSSSGSTNYIVDPTYRMFQLQTSGLVQTQWIWGPSAGNWTKKDETTFTNDTSPASLSNLRPIEIKKTANTGSGAVVKRTTISYLQRDGMWLPENKDEFVNGSTTLYRRTTLTYTSYPSQSILGLVQQTSTYDGALTLLARTVNNYDETGSFTDSNSSTAYYLIDASADGVIHHDDTNYGSSFTARGNLTSVVQYSVTGGSAGSSRTIKRISYDTNGNVRAETDAAGNRKQTLYTDNYTNKPSGVGQTGAYIYTAADPIGFRAGSQWDYYLGQPVKTFNLTPGSSTETQVTTLTYDAADRPLRVTRPDGGWTQTDHWDNLLATAISTYVSSSGTGHKYEQFDGAGHSFKKGNDHPDSTSGKFSGQITAYDVVGQVSDTSNVLAIDGAWAPTGEDASNSFLFTHLTRDELSRLKLITYPDTNTKQIAYDGCGCAGNTETRVTDELGQYTISKTDFLGRLSEVMEPNPSASDGVYDKAIYSYDELDRLIQIEHRGTYNGSTGYTPAQFRYFSYDGYGRLANENTPEGGTVSYTYTSNDQVQTVTNPRSITVTNSYNTRNLLTGVSYSDGTPSISFGYDNFGARTSMTDGEGAASYSYNGYRQLESETRTFTASGISSNYYKLSYTYNLTGQPTQVNYGIYTLSGSTPVYSFTKNVNYVYNNVSTLGSIGTDLISGTTTTNVLSSASYRATGAVNVLTYGNGRRLTMGYYQQRSQPASMKIDMASNPSDKIIDYSYDYYDASGNNNNRIRKITDTYDNTFTTTYTYDAYNRLTYAAASAWNSSFAYDPWGNVTNYQGMTVNYATNTSGAPATNRISTAAVGSTTYTHTYDAAGNLTNDGQQAYTYDGANRLKEVGTGGQNTYGYDGDGARVRKTESGAALFYIRSTVLKNVAMEVNSTGVVRAYVYAGGRLIAQQASDGNFYWVHQDHLGSGRRLTDSTGAMKFRSEYSAYGQVIFDWSASSAPNPTTKKFTDYERDAATGLDYANARMYGSNYGRFMTADPGGHKAAYLKRPESLNRYSYALNDPVNYKDPTGQIAFNANCEVSSVIVNGELVYHGSCGSWEEDEEGFYSIHGSGGGSGENMWVSRAKKVASKIKEKIFGSKNSCSDFFGSNASAALDDLVSRLTTGTDYSTGQTSATGIRQTYTGPLQYTTDSNGNKLYRSPTEAVIITNGPFTSSGTGKLGDYMPGTAGAQVTALLHEIAHNIVASVDDKSNVTFLIPNDGGNAASSTQNTATIVGKCKDQIFDAAKSL